MVQYFDLTFFNLEHDFSMGKKPIRSQTESDLDRFLHEFNNRAELTSVYRYG